MTAEFVMGRINVQTIYFKNNILQAVLILKGPRILASAVAKNWWILISYGLNYYTILVTIYTHSSFCKVFI